MSTLYYTDEQVTLHHGDAFDVGRELPHGSADCIVTSPPYFGLRDYGADGQYGLENSPAEYVETMRELFAELRRVLADDGTLWLNLGDSYASSPKGSVDSGTSTLVGPNQHHTTPAGLTKDIDWHVPQKNMLGIPWRVAFALQDDGWILRNAIIWHKPNAMPESVRDRLSGRYEHVFLFSKSPRYWFDLDQIRIPATQHRRGRKWGGVAAPQPNLEPTGSRHTAQCEQGRNPGDVWDIPTQPFTAAHFAVMPVTLAQRCILAGCKPGGTVLDPFSGSGTTGYAAQRTGRKYVGIDINAEYLNLSLNHPQRLQGSTFDFG